MYNFQLNEALYTNKANADFCCQHWFIKMLSIYGKINFKSILTLNFIYF